MIRKLLAVGALVLATMCLTAPASYADVVLDPVVTVDQVVPTAFELAGVADVFDITAPMIAASNTAMPGTGDDGEEEPTAALCPRLTPEPIGGPLRIDDVGWCSA